jgi:anti-sigma regulatory factor (Ser/Thr protein kinase)
VGHNPGGSAPSRLAALRRAARAYLRGVSDEAADGVVLALHEVATNAVLHGSGGGQPIQVRVQVDDGWVEASALDHGPQPPAGLPVAADPASCALAGGAWDCCGGWWMRSALSGSSAAPVWRCAG